MEIKVLCLDDEPSVRLSLERSLRRSFTVKTVATHDEALQSLVNFSPDIFLCDQFVGQLSFLSFLKQVAQTHPQLPVLALTGDDEIQQINEVQKFVNFRAVLKKPINSVELKRLILENC